MKGSVYMKKIVVFLLCLISLSQISLFAKMPENIYIGGSGNFQSYFESMDIPLQNYQFEGNRAESIFYLDEEDTIQNVLISTIPMEKLEEGSLFLTSKSFRDNQTIHDVYPIDSVSYYIVGDILDDSGTVVSSFVQFVVHEQVVYSKSYQGTHLIYLKNIVVVENRVYVLYVRKLHEQHGNLGILELSTDVKEIRRKEFIGEKEETAQDLYYWNNHLYIVGESSSETGIYADGSPFSIVLLRVYLHDFNQVDVKCIGNNGMNFLVDSSFDSGSLYILLKLSGNDGAYRSPEWTYRNYLLMQLDQNLSEVGLQYFKQDMIGQFEALLIKNHAVIAISQRYTQSGNILTLHRFNSNLYKQKEVEVVIASEEYVIESLSYYIESDIFFSLGIQNRLDQSTSTVLFCIDEFLDTIYLQEIEISFLDIIFIRQDGVGITFFGNTENEISLFKATYVKTESVKVVNNTVLLCDVVIHQSRYTLEESPLFFEENRLYGKNRIGFYLDLEDTDILLKIDAYLPSNVNIVSEEQYDLNVQLDFFGEGYLNEVQIPKDYVVLNEGRYLLEVEGNLEKRSISFEVKPLSVPLIETSIEEVKDVYLDFVTKQSETGFVHYTLTDQKSNEDSVIPVYIFLAILAIILGYSFHRITIKSRK